MPICTLETNLGKEKIPKDFHVKLANVLAATLKKDLERISVTISPGLMMTRGGSTDPTATLHIWSIAVF
ncbi:hypothetical protein HELRODRAFT_127579, partial [Helobdella robusta]|uniref:D-dopachrome decarboxylase n=1 Tax=Helobdella robusta TaxID=6412 RepID=T1EHF5_HELRO